MKNGNRPAVELHLSPENVKSIKLDYYAEVAHMLIDPERNGIE